MEVNLGIWPVVIGLMELGCAVTWNHDEQFVEGDFPYYPYTNRIYSYGGDTDGLTDARIRSNEFSGFKTALNHRKVQEKRKSLYEFNKDSNKLIDATKFDSDEHENVESAHSRKLSSSKLERSNSAEPRNSGSDGSEVLNSAEHDLKSAKSEKLRPAGSEKLNPADSDKSDLPHGSPQSQKPNSSRLEKLKSAKARNSDLDGSEELISAGHELNSAKSEKLCFADSEKSDVQSASEKAKLETKMLSRSFRKVAEIMYDKSPGLMMRHDKRFRRNWGHGANFAWSRPVGESNSRELWAHGIPSATPSAGSPKRKFAREYKPNDKSRKLTLVAPYETNFTGGGFHSVNPSSWLAKEIEKFIRRKDHRWLDFMKNTGMDVKKYSGVVSDAKQKSDKTNKKKTSCINCLKPSAAPTGLDDPAKLKADLLISRIDSLLADLNQFRSSVKNGWSDINSIKKNRESETSQKLTNDDIMDRRKHRLRRGIRLGRISALTRPPAGPATASDLVENDLRDLKKNVVLYQNRIPGQEMQALEDMKLHVKVYVEKEKDHEREDRHTSGSEMDDYESYPQQIDYLK